jgi:hypothetical protein
MSIEAMKQALEALDYAADIVYSKKDDDIIGVARKSLRQAIAEAEKESTLQEMSDIGQDIEQWDTSDMAHRPNGLSVEQAKLCKYCGGIGRVVCDGRCMPEQEPVTWAETNDMVCALLRQAHDVLACASYPFKRPWAGLTDEEIKEILDCGRGGLVDIKKAEQILKERNT